MKFIITLVVIAVAIAYLNTFTTSEETKKWKEDGSLTIRSENKEVPSIWKGPRKCSSIKRVPLDYQTLVSLSPLYISQATSPAFNCTQLIYIGYKEEEEYTSTIFGLQSGNYFSLDVQFIDGNRTVNATWCGSGLKAQYPIIYARFDDKINAYCAIECTPNGVGYLAAYCAGKTQKDGKVTWKFLNKTFGGILPILDMRSGCPQPQHCYAFKY